MPQKHRFRQLILLVAITGVLAFAGLAIWRKSASVSEIKADTGKQPAAFPASPGAGDWPWWRGTSSRNVAEAAKIPVDGAEGRNVAWKEPLEGHGHSSPVVRWGEVVVFAADEAKQEHFLACHDLETGKRKWRTVVNVGGFMAKHEKNSHASATPIHDGERIYVVYAARDAIHVSAVAVDGSLVWKTEAGPHVPEWGYGSSPALCGNKIIVVADSRRSKWDRLKSTSFMAAIDRTNGDMVWRVRRPEVNSYGAPLVAEIAGKKQLVVPGPKAVTSYDPETGEPIWTFATGAERTANSLAFDEGGVVAAYNQGGRETLRIKGDGSGDVSATHAAWRNKAASSDVPSPLILNGRVYVADDKGVVSCLRLADGKTLWKERVSKTGVSSSPTGIGNKVYLADEAGDVHILEDGDEYVSAGVVGTGSPIFASPVVSGDRLLLRTATHLWCVRAGGPPD